MISDELLPTMDATLQRPHGTLAFDDSGGSGEPILLLPGIGDLRQEYRFLTPALVQAGYRTVTVDLRGHGGSGDGFRDYTVAAVAGDILALIDHLDAGPATVIGTSFAPAAAVWAAAQAPGKIRRLVLISPHLEAPTGMGARLTTSAMGALLQLLLRGPWKARAWAGLYASWYPSRKPADFSAYRLRIQAMAASPARARAIRRLLTASRDGVAERIDQVARSGLPTLVVMGSKDSHFRDPEADARHVAGRLGGEVHIVAGAGHYPQAEMPEQVTAAVLDFLGGERV